MIRARDDDMGRFSVTVELANNDDLVLARTGNLPPEQVRRATVRGVVDSGAARLVLPLKVVNELGLPTAAEATVRYADGRTATRNISGALQLTYGDRSGVFDAIAEPDRDSALIGAIVMEALDLIIDCTHQTLVPRDPRRIISEIE